MLLTLPHVRLLVRVCVTVTYSHYSVSGLTVEDLEFYYCKSQRAGFLQLADSRRIRTVGGGLAFFFFFFNVFRSGGFNAQRM